MSVFTNSDTYMYMEMIETEYGAELLILSKVHLYMYLQIYVSLNIGVYTYLNMLYL